MTMIMIVISTSITVNTVLTIMILCNRLVLRLLPSLIIVASVTNYYVLLVFLTVAVDGSATVRVTAAITAAVGILLGTGFFRRRILLHSCGLTLALGCLFVYSCTAGLESRWRIQHRHQKSLPESRRCLAATAFSDLEVPPLAQATGVSQIVPVPVPYAIGFLHRRIINTRMPRESPKPQTLRVAPPSSNPPRP